MMYQMLHPVKGYSRKISGEWYELAGFDSALERGLSSGSAVRGALKAAFMS
jgi:lipocalin